ncbi:MAG: 30S ribosomal protein S2 [Nanoarchaeota archaeon]|nr:30S ribosomal protein S2 [Nanoarchaeota archaeon]MBU4242353.1 30S ribosomal protein S2 [Nanoarchaeota archaeon]MBU4352213.1 30S ribosomal protein S2 [Nanoarchaeota archaeon]MBU4456071.1 30S ribosomal protein S2 [Nanoarchaeota archaeon]MCG2720304.1 30S ribosomal protein S2 [Nanoarchaeota archaeon]
MEEELLIPLDTYLKVGLHIGTKFKTKYMESFIYKVRNDGLSVMNVKKISERIEMAANMMARYSPDEILFVCRRENGWKPAKLFAKLTGIKVIAGRYRPGLLTNSNLEDFSETKLLMAIDPWPDKNAIMDAVSVGVPIIAFCDTNNESNYVDLVVPCNNKGKKSLALIFWVLAKEYLKRRGLLKNGEDIKETLDDFTPE